MADVLSESQAVRAVIEAARKVSGLLPAELRSGPVLIEATARLRDALAAFDTVVKAICHSCNDASKPIVGARSFEGEGPDRWAVCAECMEGIDNYGEATSDALR